MSINLSIKEGLACFIRVSTFEFLKIAFDTFLDFPEMNVTLIALSSYRTLSYTLILWLFTQRLRDKYLSSLWSVNRNKANNQAVDN